MFPFSLLTHHTADALGSFQDCGLEEQSKPIWRVFIETHELGGSSTNGNMVYVTALQDFEE